MSDATDQIRNLLHRYAEAVDTGQFKLLDELFAHAQLRAAIGTGEPGPPTAGTETAARYGKGIIFYADGTPRTRHMVTNEIIDIDEKAGTATSRSYNTTLQQVPGHPLEIIATARYEDRFERVGGTWRFSERVIRAYAIDGEHRDFIGDMSRHTRSAPARS